MVSTDKINVPVILGPTGSGKSSLAMNIAQQFNFSIISCDSRQIYRYMNIGTAKPSTRELKQVKHYMIDIIDPNEDFSAFHFQEKCGKIIRECNSRGEKVLLCGGTGLYFEALKNGVGPQISTDPEIVKKYSELAKKEGRESVHKKLSKVDPVSAKKLHPNDLQRVIRALAVFEGHGMSITELQKRKEPPQDIVFSKLIMMPPRDELYTRINERVTKMASKGLYDEFKGLLDLGYVKNDPGMRSVGYQEFFNLKDNSAQSMDTALDLIRQNSRKYAKRQITWFKNREGGNFINPMEKEYEQSVFNNIKKFLDI